MVVERRKRFIAAKERLVAKAPTVIWAYELSYV